ncbi:hypothetical protein ADL19_05675 [Streptomyces purpurogeneiscleroticus]|nr:hypothetical protein ADL19_05675 [Streptomyces purpurogeneiscleroticus]
MRRSAAERDAVKVQELIEVASNAGFQHLVKGYCRLDDEQDTWSIEGACIKVEQARHRTGVPRDAQCVRYEVEHPEAGWSFTGRAVWRANKLFEPKATHTIVESVRGDARYGHDDDAVAVAVNDWLMCL